MVSAVDPAAGAAPTTSTIKDTVNSAKSKAKEAFKNTFQDMTRTSTIRLIRPTVSKFRLSRQEASMLLKTIFRTARWEDLLLILVVGWCTVPAFQIPYDYYYEFKTDPSNADDPVFRHRRNKQFRESILYALASHLSQIAKIAFAVYIVDVIQMFVIGLNLVPPAVKNYMENAPHAFAQSCYIMWFANRMVKLKKVTIINRYISNYPESFGRMKLINRLVDATLYSLALFIILQILKIEMGIAIQSMLAFGSVGTLAVGLASQNIISQLLHGLLLATSDRIYEGDRIATNNGSIQGTIVKLGWLETVIRGADEITLSIPNNEMVKHQVKNLSRIRYCQVQQVLKFPYREQSKLPALLKSIKEEIQLACPQVITNDRSRPFRAHWTNFNDKDLEVTVECHFQNIKPIGEEYWDNRQQVLQAIYRAAAINEVSFSGS